MSNDVKGYNVTTTFYAKWILPFILIIIGVGLILLFFPGTNFTKGKDYETNQEVVFYIIEEKNKTRYVDIDSKLIYDKTTKGSYKVYIKSEDVYEKHIPWYSSFRMNLSTMGSAGGAGLTVVGVFMLFINTFNKLSKVNTKKHNLDTDLEDEED
ncbi:MAG: hypothetical protein J6Y28_00250 [Acholeplasmatales bacterium]|nr:hypothetical protein [Acholeplasmatales bacterium]